MTHSRPVYMLTKHKSLFELGKWLQVVVELYLTVIVRMASNSPDKVFGYVQGVSPVKKSRMSRPYFNFHVQTGEEEWHRAVCFEEKLQGTVQSFSSAESAIQISNVRKTPRRDDPVEVDFIMNNKSKIAKASNKDVPFNFQIGEHLDAVRLVEVDDIKCIQRGQLVEIKGSLKIEEGAAEEVVRINGRNVPFLERAIITDHSGSIPFTIWGDLIDTLRTKSGNCFMFKNVRVKQFRGEKRLATTTETTFTPMENEFPEPNVEELHEHLKVKERRFREITMAENLRRFACCRRCEKFLTDEFTQDVVKCSTCGVVQKPNKCGIRYVQNIFNIICWS